jgi:5'-3' exonuclease
MKLNEVIDASGIFYRSLFTIGNYGTEKGQKLLDSKKSQGIFIRKLATDFSSLVRSIDEPARVIVCLDSSSWRKSIEIEDGGYKGDREEKKEESPVNWKVFYELTDKFASILSQKGYVISRIPGAEADDLLFFWSEKLNNMQENVLLITGDRDLLQVLKKHENGSWTIALDPVINRKKISLTQDTFDLKNTTSSLEVNIFNPDSWSSSNDVLTKLINSHEINIVNTQRICNMKVILGDGGDAVPSCISWPDKKEPHKIRTMTENNYSKILANTPQLIDATWEELYEGAYIEEISSVMEDLKKITVDREKVRDNLKRNCKLVILSNKTIPSQISESFNKIHSEIPDVMPITTRDGILNGTEWWTSDKTAYVPKSYDLFGDE